MPVDSSEAPPNTQSTMSAVLTYDQTPSQGSVEGEKDVKYGSDVADNQQGVEPAVLEDGEANLKIDRESLSLSWTPLTSLQPRSLTTSLSWPRVSRSSPTVGRTTRPPSSTSAL